MSLSAEELFERGGAHDTAGEPDLAEPLYRAALAAGLDAELRPQAVIQLASTLRNLGKVDESIAMLQDELERGDGGPYRDAVSFFLALALSSADQDRAALKVALEALRPHLPRYQISTRHYIDDL